VKALKTYLSALENRNALLKQQKFGNTDDFENELAAWDEQLAAAAAPIVNTRRWFLEELSGYASRQYAEISENPASLTKLYIFLA
jgi:recombinational DNA repair ATPase RecF